MLGREVRTPYQVALGTSTPDKYEQVKPYGAYVMSLKNTLNHAHRVVRKHLRAKATRRADAYDVKSNLNSYNVGDLFGMLMSIPLSKTDVTNCSLHTLARTWWSTSGTTGITLCKQVLVAVKPNPCTTISL